MLLFYEGPSELMVRQGKKKKKRNKQLSGGVRSGSRDEKKSSILLVWMVTGEVVRTGEIKKKVVGICSSVHIHTHTRNALHTFFARRLHAQINNRTPRTLAQAP